MTNFATKNEKIKSSINENFTAKKMKISKFWGKYILWTPKKAKNMYNLDSGWNSMLFLKKNHVFTFLGFM